HQREVVGELIRRKALAYAIAEVTVEEINTRGLGWANVDIFRRLVAQVDADGYCCDGKLRIDAVRPVHSLVAGDRTVAAWSAPPGTTRPPLTSSANAARRGQFAQPHEPPQHPPPLEGAYSAAAPVLGDEPAWTATRLIRGMLARLSQDGHTAASSRSAIGRS